MVFFKALVLDKSENGQTTVLRDFDEAGLMDGDVTVRVAYSSLNYKDGLALTGMAPVVRRFPMIPGIDFAGIVESSSHPDFKEGDKVLLNGWGTGETHLGAYAEKTRVKGDWLLHLPKELSMLDAMTIGTAGYTAMLCVIALERHGITADHGAVVVSGASGGVGSVAIMLLAKLGWSVSAITGRLQESTYLKSLGANEILPRQDFSIPAKPLSKERWGAAIDTVGSNTLANILSQIRYDGAVAACGLAGGMDIPGSVMPFILRNVALLGVDSVMCPIQKRREAWERLAKDLNHTQLSQVRSIISLDEVATAGKKIISGKIKGRTVVEINSSLDRN